MLICLICFTVVKLRPRLSGRDPKASNPRFTLPGALRALQPPRLASSGEPKWPFNVDENGIDVTLLIHFVIISYNIT